MKYKIGITSKVLGSWRHFENQLASYADWDALEINLRDQFVPFKSSEIQDLRSVLSAQNGHPDLSLHSRVSCVFDSEPVYAKQELTTLESEIKLCSTLGIKEIVFHLTDEKITEDQGKKLGKVAADAGKYAIKLYYEMNKRTSADTVHRVLGLVPNVEFNLDIGHLNVSYQTRNLGQDRLEFVKEVAPRTGYLHLHSNNGQKDEHKSLSNGSSDWRRVLDNLDLRRIRKFIIEQEDPRGILESDSMLRLYLGLPQREHGAEVGYELRPVFLHRE